MLAKANEEKSGDVLAGVAASSAIERIAAKEVLADTLLCELRENPVSYTHLLFSFESVLLMFHLCDGRELTGITPRPPLSA